MDFIIDAIVEWLKGLLVDCIMGNLDGLCLLYTSISHTAPDRPDGVAVGGDTLDQHRIDGDTD